MSPYDYVDLAKGLLQTAAHERPNDVQFADFLTAQAQAYATLASALAVLNAQTSR